MTKADKPVKRESYSCYRGDPIIIEVHPTFVKLRLKRKRFSYTVTIDQLWNMGARNEAEAKRQEKIAAKKAKAALQVRGRSSSK